LATTGTEIILALDSDDLGEALRMVDMTRDRVRTYKVGSILFTRYGTDSVRRVKQAGGEVFLDLKFHDIPNTVRGAARAASGLGVRLFTVHAPGGVEMMRAAAEGAAEGAVGAGVERPLVVGVTVLTSIRGEGDTLDLVLRRAAAATEAGIDGVVCSAREVSAVKSEYGSGLVAVVPGIRLGGESGDDQARVATPGGAASAGADFLVIGRSVTRAADPAAVLEHIEEDIRNA